MERQSLVLMAGGMPLAEGEALPENSTVALGVLNKEREKMMRELIFDDCDKDEDGKLNADELRIFADLVLPGDEVMTSDQKVELLRSLLSSGGENASKKSVCQFLEKVVLSELDEM